MLNELVKQPGRQCLHACLVIGRYEPWKVHITHVANCFNVCRWRSAARRPTWCTRCGCITTAAAASCRWTPGARSSRRTATPSVSSRSFYLWLARSQSVTNSVNKKHREHAHFTSQSLEISGSSRCVCVSRVMNAPLSLFPAHITLFHSVQVSLNKIVFLLLGKCDFYLFHWESSIKKNLMANRGGRNFECLLNRLVKAQCCLDHQVLYLLWVSGFKCRGSNPVEVRSTKGHCQRCLL